MLFPKIKNVAFLLRKRPLLPCDFWVASGTWRNVITCAYLFGLSCRARGLNSNTFLDSYDCFVRLRKNSLHVSVVIALKTYSLKRRTTHIKVIAHKVGHWILVTLTWGWHFCACSVWPNFRMVARTKRESRPPKRFIDEVEQLKPCAIEKNSQKGQ